MIKIENTEVIGWEHAIRGMRNPMNSWDKSDSYDAVDCGKCGLVEEKGSCKKEDRLVRCENYKCYAIGENDLSLMKKLSKAGTDHRKFMRMVTVYADIVAPDYWFKEFSTYRVGVTENSTSTMHKIHEKEFAIDDFSVEHLIGDENGRDVDEPIGIMNIVIDTLNEWRKCYIQDKEKDEWWQMIQLLPMSYNYRRTVCMNYEVLSNIYKSRKNHKLDEWREFCKWIESLPYSELITGKIDE